MFPELSTIFRSSLTPSTNKILARNSVPLHQILPSYSQIFQKSSLTSPFRRKFPTQMPSETDLPDRFPQSLAETLRNSSGGAIPLILSLFAGVNLPPEIHHRPDEPLERVVLINALTQTMVVLESGGGGGFDDSLEKSGGRPASKASIDAMPSVEVVSGGGEQCAVCLEGWEGGETAKEMPCKHRFHGGCIERWLNVNGSCPVCRYQMPEAEEEKNRDERESMRGI